MINDMSIQTHQTQVPSNPSQPISRSATLQIATMVFADLEPLGHRAPCQELSGHWWVGENSTGVSIQKGTTCQTLASILWAAHVYTNGAFVIWSRFGLNSWFRWSKLEWLGQNRFDIQYIYQSKVQCCTGQNQDSVVGKLLQCKQQGVAQPADNHPSVVRLRGEEIHTRPFLHLSIVMEPGQDSLSSRLVKKIYHQSSG